MKKIILTFCLLLCAATSSILAINTHRPAPGAIQLGGLPSFDPNGTIMNTILHDPNFEEERSAIKTFLQSTTINQNYQSIVAAINNAPANMAGALESLEAFERAIMNYIHAQNYIVTVENKWLNIFITGIRWNWINPKCWIQPSYWFSDNSQTLQQCMQELANLALVASKHSIITSTRMKATVESYLHWRKNLLTLMVTYFTANLASHGWNKSSLKTLKNGGLKNLNKVIIQARKDIVDFTKYGSKTVYNGAKSVKDMVQPISNAIWYGEETPDNKKDVNQDNNNLVSSDDKKNRPNNIYATWKDFNKSLKKKFFE